MLLGHIGIIRNSMKKFHCKKVPWFVYWIHSYVGCPGKCPNKMKAFHAVKLLLLSFRFAI